MKSYLSVFNKKEKYVIGALSGTSVDAVDIVLVKITGSGNSTKVKVIDSDSFKIENDLKNHILKVSSKQFGAAEDICKLNFIIASLFVNCIKKIISRNKSIDIDLIGSHGQTIYHYPINEKLYGFNSKSTLQIGDPSVIANQTKVLTVGDFRVADVSAGGDGAPLVPYLDYILFSHKKKNRALLNIGGISNATYLKKGCKQNEVIAFDMGPGNMILDYLSKRFFNKRFDDKGKIASRGKVNDGLFNYMRSNDRFYKKKFPKSTGREYYSDTFIESILSKFKKISPEDIISTFTKFTAYSIHFNLKRFDIDELVASGGGVKNNSLMKFLNEYFTNVDVNVINEFGINADNKESVLFAVLANEIVSGNRANMTSVTGSDRNVFLGKICPA